MLNVFIRTGGFRVVQYLVYHTDMGMTFQDGEPDVLQDLLGAAPLTVLAVRDGLFVAPRQAFCLQYCTSQISLIQRTKTVATLL